MIPTFRHIFSFIRKLGNSKKRKEFRLILFWMNIYSCVFLFDIGTMEIKICRFYNNVYIAYNLSYCKIMSWSMNVNISELKIFEIFSLHLTDKIHFWQDVCLKDCDHLHQFNLRYYKPNVCVSVHHLTAII